MQAPNTDDPLDEARHCCAYNLVLAQEKTNAVLTQARALGDTRGEAAALALSGTISLHLGALQAAEEDLDGAQTLAHALGLVTVEAEALAALAMLARRRNDSEKLSQNSNLALVLYRSLSDPCALAAVLHNLALHHLAVGSYDAAFTVAAEAQGLCPSLLQPRLILVALKRELGELAEAQQILESSWERLPQNPSILDQVRILLPLAEVLIERGALVQAEMLVRESEPLVVQLGDPRHGGELALVQAALAMHAGDSEDAKCALQEAHTTLRHGASDTALRVRILRTEAELYWRLGEREHALGQLHTALTHAESAALFSEQGKLHRLLSDLYEEQAQFERALLHLRASLRFDARREAQLAYGRHLAQKAQQEAAQLNEEVHRDTLTGAYNRRFYLDYLSQRGIANTALVLVDLDNFKRINDTWGHRIGDEVLTQTAVLLRQGCRSGDLIVRYGGEEFLILLTNTRPECVALVCERLRKLIAEYDWSSLYPALEVTVSIGAAFAHGADAETLQHRADTNLYAAKRSGKNCVRVSV